MPVKEWENKINAGSKTTACSSNNPVISSEMVLFGRQISCTLTFEGIGTRPAACNPPGAKLFLVSAASAIRDPHDLNRLIFFARALSHTLGGPTEHGGSTTTLLSMEN
ncbi:MAG: hypothetical protein COA62_08370 [Rhodobiaceae bacterium]|nr:MAG: hypothetical protein COA62_08370 [Rhodobiaceae bacterium]